MLNPHRLTGIARRALLFAVLAGPVAVAARAADTRVPLTAEQVACNADQLLALLQRMDVRDLSGARPPVVQSLFVSYANPYGFFDGTVVGMPRYRSTVEPPVVGLGPGPEHQLGFNLNPSVRELLLNPERTPLEQIGLARETSTSNLVPVPADGESPFAVVLTLDPTLAGAQGGQGGGDADLVIDNLAAPPEDPAVSGFRPADTKPGRGLTEAGITTACHGRFTALDRRIFSILQRTLRVELSDPDRLLRYDTRIAVFRGEAPDQYRALVLPVDPETGTLLAPLALTIQVSSDGTGRLTDGHLDVALPEVATYPVTGTVEIVRPLFEGENRFSQPEAVYPVDPSMPDPGADPPSFDWRDVLEDSAWNTGTPVAEQCGHGTAAEIAMTPRADQSLEHLALEMGGTFTADQAIYDRVVADVTAFRSAHPEIAAVEHLGTYRPDEVLLVVPPSVYQEMAAGTYTAWDCLNSWYDLSEVEPEQYSDRYVTLVFDGVYDIPTLATDYAALPGVTTAQPNGINAFVELCGKISGATYEYVIRQGSGDCPAGCIHEDLTYFTSAPGEAPVLQDTWSGDVGDPRPAWADDCRP